MTLPLASIWRSIIATAQYQLALPALDILFMNRNARVPKKANHGARPCSSVVRREKRKENYRRWKKKTPADTE